MIEKVENFISAWQDPDLYVETQTSGSTGIPKTIRLEKEKMQFSARMTGKFFNFKPRQKILLCLSPDSIGGKMLILRAILHEMELVVSDIKRNPMEKIDFQLDFAAMVPMQIQSILRENPEKIELVNQLLIGGAAVSPFLQKELESFSIHAFESFGMTETMSHIAIRKLNTAMYHSDREPFQALNGIHFSLHDEKLVIHAPDLGLPSLQTNDVVELIGDQKFHWKGRSDYAINSGGIKFHPEMIERKLGTVISERFFITGEKDEMLGEKIVLVIEAAEEEALESRIRELLKTRLGVYETPKKLYFAEKFAETPSGKVNRLETMKMLKD